MESKFKIMDTTQINGKVFQLGNSQIEEKLISMNENFRYVFDFLKEHSLSELASFDGRMDLKNDVVFVGFSTAKGKEIQDAKLEAHDKYIDLQLLIDGDEKMGIKPRKQCNTITIDNLADKDVVFFDDACDEYITLKAGEFVVFTPEMAHAPMISKGIVKKCVFKIA